MASETANQSPSALRTWRTGVLNVILTAAAVIMVVPLGATFAQAFRDASQWPAVILFSVCYLLIVALAIWRRLDPTIRAWGLLLVGYGVAVLSTARGGLAGDGRTYLLALPVLAVILAGMRSAVTMAVLSVVTYAAFALIARAGGLDDWLVIADNSTALADWLEVGTDLVAVLALLVLLLWRFLRFQERTLDAERRSADELGQASLLLQERAEALEQANALLAERTEMLTIAAEVAGQIASLTDEGSLVEEFVRLASQRLRIDEVQLLMVNDGRTHAILRAASSEGGRRLLEGGYQVRLGSGDAVSQAIRDARDVLLSAAEEAGESRWRIAIPLQVRRNVIGALVVGSRDEQSVPQERLQALRALADQLATNLENVRLFRQAQESLEAERQARGELGREAWRELVRARRQAGYLRNRDGMAPVSELRPRALEVLATGQVVRDGAGRGVTVPIRVRGQVIGAIEARTPTGTGGWTQENVALLETLTEQLGVALESARLYQDTQRRAAREQMVGEVTARMRESLDMEQVLRTAVEEFYQALGLQDLAISLTVAEPDGSPDR